jgi:hypothetical protein
MQYLLTSPGEILNSPPEKWFITADTATAISLVTAEGIETVPMRWYALTAAPKLRCLVGYLPKVDTLILSKPERHT